MQAIFKVPLSLYIVFHGYDAESYPFQVFQVSKGLESQKIHYELSKNPANKVVPKYHLETDLKKTGKIKK